jgi:adenine-specific DNA-methyltransferase
VEELQGGDTVYSSDGSTTNILDVLAVQQDVPVVTIVPRGDMPAISVSANLLILCRWRPRSLGGNRDWSGSPAGNQPHRRHLRRETSPPERALWQRLKGQALGYKFRRQHPIGPYIADFYCRDANLVVEVDGYSHSGERAHKHDRQRDAFMRSLGLRVLRISAKNVGEVLNQVVSMIEGECQRPFVSSEEAEWIQADQLSSRDILYLVSTVYEAV